MTSVALQKAATRRHVRRRAFPRLGLGLAALFILSLQAGRYPSPGIISWQQISQDELARLLLINLRLPRLLTALLLGVSLSAAGMVFQMLFANPLVEPGFLGVSQGAAFGAALCIVLSGKATGMIQGVSAFFAFGGLGLSYLLARQILLCPLIKVF